MARRDAELVIRAKDQAGKAVDAITSAIEGLVTAQGELSKGADKSNSALTRLGTAVASIDKALKGVNVSETLAKELESASTASERLRNSMATTASESSRLARELVQASNATAELRRQAGSAEAIVNQQAAALQKSRAEHAALTKELREATTTRDKLSRADDRLVKQIEKAEARLLSAKDKFAKLSQEMAATASPTETFRARVEAAATAVQKAESRLTQLQEESRTTKAALTSAGSSVENLSSRLAQAAANVEKQKAALAASRQEYANISAAVKSAAASQKNLDQAAEASKDALRKQQDEFARSRQSMADLTQRADAAKAAMAELATEARGPMLKALGQQRATVLQLEKAWAENQAAIRQLSAEMRAVESPTQQMLSAFELLQTAARSAKEETLKQRVAYQQLRTELRSTATDVDQLAAKQRVFAGAMTAGGEAVNRVNAQTATAASAMARLRSSSEQASGALGQAGQRAQNTAGATGRAATATDRLSQAYRKLYGESRTAMSWTQRLRGEVLSLIATYAGFYGVINILNQTVEAYQALEAATSRLNVVLDGDQTRTQQELDFVRRTAERLGIQFGVLAQEYSKFAVATKDTNLEGANTRKIFVAVAEAARVNRTSTEQMAGTLVALTQIVSKGAVQMEELRQQLGDRLPGALQIMADGLGVTTAELIKMMEQGQVSSDALIGFADELNKRFGPQLENALQTTAAEMGKFQNVVFQTLLAFGKAGFVEAFTRLLRDMTTTMKSADFQAFLVRLSQGFATLTDVVGLAVKNFRLLAAALTAFAAVKVLPLVVALVAGLRDMIYTARGAAQAAQIVAASNAAMAGSTTAAAGAMGRLTLATRAFMSSTGIGIIVTAVAAGLALWATNADTASLAMEAHAKVVDAVKNAYDEAGDSANNWAQTIKTTTITEVQDAIAKAQAAQRKAMGDIAVQLLSNNSPFNILDQTKNLIEETARSQSYQMEELVRQFSRGERTAESFRSVLDSIAQTAANDLIRQIAKGMIEQSYAAEEAQKRTGDLEAALRIMQGTATDADYALLGLADSTEKAGKNFDNGEFKKALEKINDLAEKAGQGLDDLKKKAEIDDAFKAAAKAATTMSELAAAVQAANDAWDAFLQKDIGTKFADFTSGAEAAASLIRLREGFSSTPYNDPRTNSLGQQVGPDILRAGFGSDTITLADGTIQKITDGMRVSVEDANRDLLRRIEDLRKAISDTIGAERFNAMTPQQQAALTSIAYNYGALPDRIVNAIKTGTDAEIADAIRQLGSDNGGVNQQRRQYEAALFNSTSNPQIVEKTLERIQKEQERADQYKADLQQRLVEQQAELDNAGKLTREAAIQKALHDEIKRAKTAGVELSKEELAEVERLAGAVYDQKHGLDEANDALAKANALYSQQSALETQLAEARKSGDGQRITELGDALERVNAELATAIDAAIQMWQAVGGPDADIALAKLEALKTKSHSAAVTTLVDWKQVGDLFVNGLVNAVDKFAQAVAEGKDIGEAARDAFLQFASDFLIEMGKMILKQIIFNALRAVMAGFGIPIGVGHTGGIVGSSAIGSGNGRRTISPAVFTGAFRYHSGGIAGLKPGEVPAILKQNEEILTQDDPRHILNGGGAAASGSQSPLNLKVINAIDPASFISSALDTPEGEKAVLNFLKANKTSVRSIIQ